MPHILDDRIDTRTSLSCDGIEFVPSIVRAPIEAQEECLYNILTGGYNRFIPYSQ